MATVLITGANRGIGFELAKQMAARGDRVIGTARGLETAEALSDFAEVLPLDVSANGPKPMHQLKMPGLVVFSSYGAVDTVSRITS